MATNKHGQIVCALVILGMATACGGGNAEPKATDTAAPAAAAAPAAPERPVDKSAEGDFARNIEQIAAGVSDAKANFADDLVALADGKLSRAAAEGLAEQLSAAISGKTFTPEQAGAMAKAVLAAAAGSGTAKADLEAALVAVGAPADKAAAAGVAASKLGAK